MFEYVFFNKEPLEIFISFLDARDVVFKMETKENNFEIAISENIDDDISDKIDDRYDQLLEMDQLLFEEKEVLEYKEGENSENYNKVGLSFKLGNGITSNASVDPKIIAKILEVVTPKELNTVINAIVFAVENPDERTVCQQIRDKNS